MNLLAFLVLIGAIWSLLLMVMFGEQVTDIFKAIAERIRNPRLTALEELHRHWEAMAGVIDDEEEGE